MKAEQVAAQPKLESPLQTFINLVLDEEVLLLVIAIPLLILPRSYLWQWQRGLTHYAPVEDRALAYPGWTAYIGLALIGLVWLLRWLRRGYLTVRTPLDAPIALYLITAAISLWPSVDRAHSLNFLLGIVAGLALYYGLVNWLRKPIALQLPSPGAAPPRTRMRAHGRMWLLVALLLAGSTALSLLGLLQTDWGAIARRTPLVFRPVYDLLEGLPKLWSKTFNVGITAGATIIFIPLGLCLLLSDIKARYKVLLAVSLISMTAFLIFTQSRGDLLSLALALLILPALRIRRWALVLLACCLLLLVATLILANFSTFNLLDFLTAIYPSRWEVWTRAFYIAMDHPFTGIGLDTFLIVAQNIYPYSDPGLNYALNTHNRFLQLWVDQGLLGFFAFLWLCVAFYNGLWVTGRGLHPQLVAGLEGSFTAFLIGGIFDDGVMTSVRTALGVWALLGVAMAVALFEGKRAKRVKAKREDTPPPLSGGDRGGVRSPFFRRFRVQFSISPFNPSTYKLLAIVGMLAVTGFVVHRPVLSIFHNNVANVYREQGWLGKDVNVGDEVVYARAALRHYRRAVELSPANSVAHRNLGLLIYHAHHPQSAFRRLKATHGYNPDDDRAAFFSEISRWTDEEQGLFHLQQAVQLAPGDLFARLFLAQANQDQEGLKGAASE